MNAGPALADASARLAAAGIENPRREARLLLAAAHHVDAAGFLRLEELDPAAYEPLLRRRLAREPLAYILGRKEFWGLEFEVSPATLIPRPDSETLIEAVLERTKNFSSVLDLGTGTGCLLLALLHEAPRAWGLGVDKSWSAAALARRNARKLGAGTRARFVVADWAAPLEQEFDVVISNPPYIRAPDIAGLMPEVKEYEPASALDGGADGLAAYRAIISSLPRLLAQNGVAVLELGAGQAHAIASLAGETFSVAVRRDLAGIERAALLVRK